MRVIQLGVLTALLALCLGCGSKTIRIEGTVTYNGKPISEGTIEFLPIEGTSGPSVGGKIKEGRYEFSTDKGLTRGGRYQVLISALAKTGRKVPNIMKPGGPPMELSENYIPAMYNSESNLKVTLSKDSTTNTFDFPLQGQPIGR
jgi:hypothetical protein